MNATVGVTGALLGFSLVQLWVAWRTLRVERQRHAARLVEMQYAHEVEVQRLRASHDREVERLSKSYERLLDAVTTAQERAIRLATTGSTEPAQEAIVEERSADAFEVVSSAVREATIDNGVAALRESYRALGVTLTDAELREEAEMLLLTGVEARFPDMTFGRAPVVPEAATQ